MARTKNAKGNIGRRTSLTVSTKRKVSGTAAAKGNRSLTARYEARHNEDHPKQRREDISKLDSDDSCVEDEGYDPVEKNDNGLFNMTVANESMDDANGGYEDEFDVIEKTQDSFEEYESDEAQHVSNREGTVEDRSTRQMELVRVYSQGNKLVKNESTMRTLAKSLRKVIIPQVKFVQCSKVFGSFDQPDFTSAQCWQNKLFSNIPSLNNATDEMKAQVWMTYRGKLKEQFSLHRSGVTLKIKRKFEEGKILVMVRYVIVQIMS